MSRPFLLRSLTVFLSCSARPVWNPTWRGFLLALRGSSRQPSQERQCSIRASLPFPHSYPVHTGNSCQHQFRLHLPLPDVFRVFPTFRRDVYKKKPGGTSSDMVDADGRAPSASRLLPKRICGSVSPTPRRIPKHTPASLATTCDTDPAVTCHSPLFFVLAALCRRG